MILDATTCTTDDQEHQIDAASPTPGSEDLESDSDDCLEQSADLEPSCEQSPGLYPGGFYRTPLLKSSIHMNLYCVYVGHTHLIEIALISVRKKEPLGV